MLRGYRGIFTAFVGLTLLGVSPSPKSQAQGQQEQGETKVGQPPSTVASSAQPVKQVDSLKKQFPCGPNQYDSNADLCAQWKAADAASQAAEWAEWSFWLGLVGTFGLLLTLHYTRKAVLAAEEATKDADRALEIAEANSKAASDLVEVSRASAEVELRPYINCDQIEYTVIGAEDGKRGLIAHFILKNSGVTPAKNVQLWGGLQIFPDKQSIQFAPLDTGFGPSITRGNGRSHGFWALSVETLSDVVQNNRIPVFFVAAYYSGMLSDERFVEHTAYRMENIAPPEVWLAKLPPGRPDPAMLRQFFQLRSHGPLAKST